MLRNLGHIKVLFLFNFYAPTYFLKNRRLLNERLLDTFMSLISSLIAYYHCKSVQYGLGGKMSRSNREAHPELS